VISYEGTEAVRPLFAAAAGIAAILTLSLPREHSAVHPNGQWVRRHLGRAPGFPAAQQEAFLRIGMPRALLKRGPQRRTRTWTVSGLSGALRN